MLSFQPIDLLLVLVVGVLLIAGISLLALRRRDEILQDFLTPDDPEIEVEFLKKREIPVPESPESPEKSEPETAPEETATWGDMTEPPEADDHQAD